MYALYSEDSTASTLANSGRHRRYIEAARKTAEDSTFPDYRHGALLVRGGSILNSAYNKNSHIGWANRFRAKSCGHATHHAELGAILGIDRAKSSGADVYVVRIGKNGELKGMFIPEGEKETDVPPVIVKMCKDYFGIDVTEEVTIH